MTMQEYVREKLIVLRDMNIKLTREEKEHMKQLDTQIQVDNYAHRLIMQKL